MTPNWIRFWSLLSLPVPVAQGVYFLYSCIFQIWWFQGWRGGGRLNLPIFEALILISRLMESNPKAVKESLMQQCAQILACYRKNCASPSSAGFLSLIFIYFPFKIFTFYLFSFLFVLSLSCLSYLLFYMSSFFIFILFLFISILFLFMSILSLFISILSLFLSFLSLFYLNFCYLYLSFPFLYPSFLYLYPYVCFLYLSFSYIFLYIIFYYKYLLFRFWIDRFTDWSRLRYWLIDWLIAYRAVNPPWVHEAPPPVHQLPAQVRRYFRGNRPRVRRQSIRHVSCQQYGRGFKCCLLLPQVQYSLFTFTPGAVHFVCFNPRCGTLCLLLSKVRYILFTFTPCAVHFVYFNPGGVHFV